MAPGPRAVKPARFFATRRAKKIQGLSYQYRHFKLFSISTGRNKPPGEISQSPRPRPPVTHNVCVPGCRRLVRPHTSGPRCLIPLAVDEYLREKSGKHHLFLRSKHPGRPRPAGVPSSRNLEAGTCPARRSRAGVARVMMGGEEESPRMGDSNPGCNYLVRGYSPSMHFFWGGDKPRYSPPLPFRRGRAGCPYGWHASAGARLGGHGCAY